MENQGEDADFDAATVVLQEEAGDIANIVEIPDYDEPAYKRQRFEEDVDILGQQCPICLEAWETTGEHRLCCLKCGHLYGLSCLKKWLSSQSSKSCPTCKKKVNRNDIRHLYAAKLIAVDNTELYQLKNDFEELTKSKTKIQSEYAKCLYQISTLKEENRNLKQQLLKLEDNSILDMNYSGSYEQPVKFYKDKSIMVNVDGGCRVMDCNSFINSAVVSSKSSNPLFYGYGLRSVDVQSYKSKGYVLLHNQPIRDVKFNQQNPWILTASMDKSFKIVDCGSSNIIKNFNCNVPLWSCTWHHQESHIFYIGDLTNVLEFDMRQMSEPTQLLKIATDMSPVLSVVSIGKQGADLNHGVLVCKLNSMWFFEYKDGTYTINNLPIEGPFTSMSYLKDKNQVTVGLRPTSRRLHTRYVLGQLCKRQDILTFDTIYNMDGLSTTQKVLSRTCFINHNNIDYFTAHQESVNNITLWNMQTGQKCSSIATRDSVLDLCNFKSEHCNYLMALSEKKLDFLKFP